MAPKSGLLSRRKRRTVSLDELGADPAGGIGILDEDGTVLHMTPSVVAKALRYLLARVDLHEGGLPHRVALSSALKREGVSYVTRSLAAVLAYDTDRSVVVVDMNWTEPTGPSDDAEADERPPGLAEAVDHDLPVEEVIKRTANPRLSLVPAGSAPVARRHALAGSAALADKLDELADRFDHVLLDLPPVLASSEAMSIAQLADGFVLVVLQGVTSEAQVHAALDELRGCDVLGVVLNRYHSRVPKRIRQLIGA
jgi:Mrp family chromosome partitioning ATPase